MGTPTVYRGGPPFQPALLKSHLMPPLLQRRPNRVFAAGMQRSQESLRSAPPRSIVIEAITKDGGVVRVIVPNDGSDAVKAAIEERS